MSEMKIADPSTGEVPCPNSSKITRERLLASFKAIDI